MIDLSPPPPSRKLHLVARVARWTLGLVLAFWLVLMGVWGALHGLIVPRIGEWRVQVERLATQALGAPVRIDALTARSEGLFPTIELSGVSILDPQQRQALMLQRVVVTVSARSVLRLGLEQLYIDAPELDVRRLQDGRWQVAGLDVVSSDATQDNRALEWLLEQPELVIQRGVVQFTDEQQSPETTQWRDVEVVVRNRHWHHVLRMDATPVAGEGERMQVVGEFRQPLLPSSLPPWQRWNGQWYAALQMRQVPALPWPQAWGIQAIEARGAVRVWVDVARGQPVGVSADVALPQAEIQWRDSQVPALQLQQLHGRLQADWQEQAWRLSGQNFSFVQVDGQHWPSSNWEVRTSGPAAQPRTQVSLDYADIAMAAQVVQALPVPAEVLAPLQRWKPEGAVRQLQLQWVSPTDYQARGRVSGLVVQPQPAEHGTGLPGVEGLNATFELDERGGKASLDLQSGVLHFPGVFEEPAIPMDTLQAQVRWRVDRGHLRLDVPALRFANADAQGQAQGSWRMGETPEDRLPGYLQLTGELERADGARVHRYLPLEVPELARHYVRDSVRQGEGRKVQFEVRGNLHDMPFEQPGSGRFYIQAPVRNVVYDFAPQRLLGAGHLPWPVLQDLSGTLVFEGNSMVVQQARTGFQGQGALRMDSIEARIPDLNHPHLTLKVAGQAPLQALLGVVQTSPLAAMTEHALDTAKAQGPASLAFELDLPIDHLERTQVQGRLGLRGNSLQLTASTPLLQQLGGEVRFSDQGFALAGVQGQSLGGPIKLDGGMASVKDGVRIQAQGQATAQGLKKDGSLPVATQLAEHAEGRAAYSVSVVAKQGQQTVVVRSDLRGLALRLPAPLNKPAEDSLGLEVTQTLDAAHRQELRVEVAGRGQVVYAQDVSVEPARVLAGRIVLGDWPKQGLPDSGVVAQVQWPTLDADAWLAVLDAGGGSGTSAVPAQAQVQGYLPQRLELRVPRLLLRQRELVGVQADLVHSGDTWRGQLQAQQFGGYVEYRSASVGGSTGRLFARLSHLSIPKAEAQRLDQAPPDDVDPDSLPALDIQVERLEIAGKALGQLSLQARNRAGEAGREWLLEQFQLTTKEARWKANGYWGAARPGAARTTHLSFLLDMDSAGQLLDRFGMEGVIRDGRGQLSGHIAWRGSPITPHWPSMDGAVHLQVDKGQFLKAEPGMGKLLSVLSLQSLSRRVTLDFRDVFSQGFAFDFIRGDVNVVQGVARTNNLQMKGLNAAVLMEGQASLVDETQDVTVVVVPEINAMTASLAATAINPVIGLGSFLAQVFLRGPLMEAATRTFHLHGTWSDPVVDPVRKRPAAAPAASDAPTTPSGGRP